MAPRKLIVLQAVTMIAVAVGCSDGPAPIAGADTTGDAKPPGPASTVQVEPAIDPSTQDGGSRKDAASSSDAASDAATPSDAGASTDANTLPTCGVVDGSKHPAIMAMAANLGGGQPLATSMMNANTPGLSVAIRDVDGVIYVAVFGNANNQAYDPGAPPLSPSTVFQAASISKAISAMAYFHDDVSAATKDVEIGTTVKDYIVPPYEMTPADLLSHAAGTAPHGYGPGYLEGKTLPTTEQIVLGQPPASSAGVSFDATTKGIFQYSGGGYMLWQSWLERVAKEPLPKFVSGRLFVAAGANRSSFTQPLTSAIDHDAACGRSSTLTKLNACRKVYAELAAAGLWTTPGDLACVTKYVTGKRPDILKLLRSRALKISGYPQAMGLGLFHRPANGVDETEGHFYEHSGVNEGFKSQMLFFDDGRAVVTMDNGFAANGGISAFAARALCRELKWPCEGQDMAVK